MRKYPLINIGCIAIQTHSTTSSRERPARFKTTQRCEKSYVQTWGKSMKVDTQTLLDLAAFAGRHFALLLIHVLVGKID